jgi:hypothetical protein
VAGFDNIVSNNPEKQLIGLIDITAKLASRLVCMDPLAALRICRAIIPRVLTIMSTADVNIQIRAVSALCRLLELPSSETGSKIGRLVADLAIHGGALSHLSLQLRCFTAHPEYDELFPAVCLNALRYLVDASPRVCAPVLCKLGVLAPVLFLLRGGHYDKHAGSTNSVGFQVRAQASGLLLAMASAGGDDNAARQVQRPSGLSLVAAGLYQEHHLDGWRRHQDMQPTVMAKRAALKATSTVAPTTAPGEAKLSATGATVMPLSSSGSVTQDETSDKGPLNAEAEAVAEAEEELEPAGDAESGWSCVVSVLAEYIESSEQYAKSADENVEDVEDVAASAAASREATVMLIDCLECLQLLTNPHSDYEEQRNVFHLDGESANYSTSGDSQEKEAAKAKKGHRMVVDEDDGVVEMRTDGTYSFDNEEDGEETRAAAAAVAKQVGRDAKSAAGGSKGRGNAEAVALLRAQGVAPLLLKLLRLSHAMDDSDDDSEGLDCEVKYLALKILHRLLAESDAASAEAKSAGWWGAVAWADLAVPLTNILCTRISTAGESRRRLLLLALRSLTSLLRRQGGQQQAASVGVGFRAAAGGEEGGEEGEGGLVHALSVMMGAEQQDDEEDTIDCGVSMAAMCLLDSLLRHSGEDEWTVRLLKQLIRHSIITHLSEVLSSPTRTAATTNTTNADPEDREVAVPLVFKAAAVSGLSTMLSKGSTKKRQVGEKMAAAVAIERLRAHARRMVATSEGFCAATGPTVVSLALQLQKRASAGDGVRCSAAERRILQQGLDDLDELVVALTAPPVSGSADLLFTAGSAPVVDMEGLACNLVSCRADHGASSASSSSEWTCQVCDESITGVGLASRTCGGAHRCHSACLVNWVGGLLLVGKQPTCPQCNAQIIPSTN